VPRRNPDKSTDPAAAPPLSSPYGPQYRGVDEAAGGADSSPYENVPSGDRREAAKAPENENRGRGPTSNN